MDCNNCTIEWEEDNNGSWLIRFCPLHAAAPELLAAAKGLADMMDDIPTNHANDMAVLKLREAIAKATAE